MIEWYPNSLVVSSIVPTGPLTCSNVIEFYYPEEIVLFEREYVEAEQAAYKETAVEDEDICQRMEDGAARTLPPAPQRYRPLPVADRGRHDALPRVHAARTRASSRVFRFEKRRLTTGIAGDTGDTGKRVIRHRAFVFPVLPVCPVVN